MAEFASELPEADGKEGTSEAVARLLLTRRMEDFRAGARLACLRLTLIAVHLLPVRAQIL